MEEAEKEGEEQEEEEEKTEKQKDGNTNFISGESTKYTNRECRTITDRSSFKNQWCISPDGSEKNLQGVNAVTRPRMLHRAGEGRPVIQKGTSLANVSRRHRHHGVQHVRDVERGEFQAGTLRDLLGLAVAVDLARTPDAAHLVGEHKR